MTKKTNSNRFKWHPESFGLSVKEGKGSSILPWLWSLQWDLGDHSGDKAIPRSSSCLETPCSAPPDPMFYESPKCQ